MQEIVEGKGTNARKQICSDPKAALKLLEESLDNWDDEQVLSDKDLEEVGWIVPPAIQSLALSPIEVTQEGPTSYHLHAANWPVEVNLATAVQDLSDYRFSIGQELESCSLKDGQSKLAQEELEEILKTLKS